MCVSNFRVVRDLALAGIAVHVAGSLAMTGLGFAMVALVRDRL